MLSPHQPPKNLPVVTIFLLVPSQDGTGDRMVSMSTTHASIPQMCSQPVVYELRWNGTVFWICGQIIGSVTHIAWALVSKASANRKSV